MLPGDTFDGSDGALVQTVVKVNVAEKFLLWFLENSSATTMVRNLSHLWDIRVL
jgi:hypothetical protein